jgi:hypothetical protein
MDQYPIRQRGSMNIPENIINRITIPTDLEEKFMYHSKRLTAAALNHNLTVQDGAQRSKRKKNARSHPEVQVT